MLTTGTPTTAPSWAPPPADVQETYLRVARNNTNY